ncbi:MAG: NAD(P)H-quinone oxidoreductase subunit 2, partial [Cyanobacteria bacterium P01_F01_bin.153]
MEFSNVASQLNAWVIMPEGVVILTLLSVLLIDLIVGRTSVRWTPYVAIAGLTASLGALWLQWDPADPIAFLGGFSGDTLSTLFRGIIALSSIVTILMSITYVERTGTALGEFLIILLTATVGGMFLSGANELVMIF